MGIRRWLSGTLRPDDVETDNITADSATVNGTTNTDTLEAKQLNSDYKYAGSYNGSDPDQRLSAALNDLNNGEVLHLENETYQNDRTITNDRITIIGTAYTNGIDGTIVNGIWTFAGQAVILERLRSANNIIFEKGFSVVSHINGASDTITIKGDRSNLSKIDNMNITFESGTGNGIVDGCTDVVVTDNGSNTIGDLA